MGAYQAKPSRVKETCKSPQSAVISQTSFSNMFPHWVAGRLSRHIHLCMFWTLQLSNDTTPIFPGSHSRKGSHMANLSQLWFTLQCPAVLFSHALRLSQLFLRDLVAFKVREILKIGDEKKSPWASWNEVNPWYLILESSNYEQLCWSIQFGPISSRAFRVAPLTNNTSLWQTLHKKKQKLININQQLTSINHQHQTTTSTFIHFPSNLFHFKCSPSDRSTCHKGWHHAHHISPPRPQLPLRHPMQRTPTPQRGHPTDGRRNETGHFHGREKRFNGKLYLEDIRNKCILYILYTVYIIMYCCTYMHAYICTQNIKL